MKDVKVKDVSLFNYASDHAMKCGGVEVYLDIILASALDA
jgi:hypothetical protein